MISGIGVDVVDIARLDAALRRTPGLAARLFTESELARQQRAPAVATLAGCFAAKEAVAKALGAPASLRWTDVQVVHSGAGQPGITMTGTVAAAAEMLGVRRWHLSISHDAGVCIALAVAEG